MLNQVSYSMLKLKDIQSLFAKAVLSDKPLLDIENKLSELLESNKKISASQQIDIYRNSVRGCMLVGGLKQNFPACMQVLTEHNFNIVGLDFLKVTHSSSPDINQIAIHFPDFLLSYDNTKHILYLPDLARLELARSTVFSAPDVMDFDLSVFNRLTDTEKLNARFVLSPSNKILSVEYSVDVLWRNLRDAHFDMTHFIVEHLPRKLIIFRKFPYVYIRTLSNEQCFFLDSVQQGMPLIEIYEGMPHNLLRDKVVQALPEAIQQGWIHLIM